MWLLLYLFKPSCDPAVILSFIWSCVSGHLINEIPIITSLRYVALFLVSAHWIVVDF